MKIANFVPRVDKNCIAVIYLHYESPLQALQTKNIRIQISIHTKHPGKISTSLYSRIVPIHKRKLMAKMLQKTQNLIQKRGFPCVFKSSYVCIELKLPLSFYKIHLNWQFNNNREGRCVHLTYILTFLVNWPLSLMFVALWLNMKFSIYCRQGIKMNTLAVAIGYIILMAPITDEIWLRTLP